MKTDHRQVTGKFFALGQLRPEILFKRIIPACAWSRSRISNHQLIANENGCPLDARPCIPAFLFADLSIIERAAALDDEKANISANAELLVRLRVSEFLMK